MGKVLNLKEGLTAAIDYERGKIDLRTTNFEIPTPPPDLSKKKIKSLRENIPGPKIKNRKKTA